MDRTKQQMLWLRRNLWPAFQGEDGASLAAYPALRFLHREQVSSDQGLVLAQHSSRNFAHARDATMMEPEGQNTEPPAQKSISSGAHGSEIEGSDHVDKTG